MQWYMMHVKCSYKISVLVRVETAELLCLLLLLNLNRYTSDFQPSFFIVGILLVVLFLFL